MHYTRAVSLFLHGYVKKNGASIMAETLDLIKLRRHRRIAWCVVFAFFFSDVLLENMGSKDAGPIALLAFLTLLYALQLGSRIRRAESEQAKLMAKGEVKLKPYWEMLAGNLLFAGFVLLMCRTAYLLASFAVIAVIGVLLPLAVSASFNAIVSARKGAYEPWRQQLWRQRWTRFLIYAIAVSAGLVLHSQASRNEQNSYDSIIVAVDQYKAVENHYPDTLAQLVPKYLTAVPTARIGKFTYSANNPDDASLSYMPEPFIHKSYSFKSKTSKTWD